MPHAWWSFCFLGQAFGSLGWFGYPQVCKLVRTPSELIGKNIYGSCNSNWPVESIEDLSYGSCFCGKYITITMTDAWVEETKATAGCCKCCVSKKNWFILNSSDHAQFLQDHGLTSKA
jgi:hypothetical protein